MIKVYVNIFSNNIPFNELKKIASDWEQMKSETEVFIRNEWNIKKKLSYFQIDSCENELRLSEFGWKVEFHAHTSGSFLNIFKN
jgi:hypothetical protein